METESPLSRSQETTIGPYPESDETIHIYKHFSQIHYNNILPSTRRK